MAGKIDRLYVIARSGKRTLKSMKFRYLSKSIFANCKGDNESYEYVNFRGAHFSRSAYRKAHFKGCDFWGTTFKKCKFNDTVFQDCVFQGCKFKDCDFTGAKIQYSAIVNTNTEECKGLVWDASTVLLKQYPEVECTKEFLAVLENMKTDPDLRKTKVLWISDKKLNHLNLFMLRRKYSEHQIEAYLNQLTRRDIKMLTTYGSMNFGLNKLIKSRILQ